jgi:hypothetical protein
VTWLEVPVKPPWNAETISASFPLEKSGKGMMRMSVFRTDNRSVFVVTSLVISALVADMIIASFTDELGAGFLGGFRMASCAFRRRDSSDLWSWTVPITRFHKTGDGGPQVQRAS